MPSATEIFSAMYGRNDWINGSGEGSSPDNTIEYRRYLQAFLRERRIRTVVDMGCGDWQFSTLIDWSGIQYLGMDVVPEIIERNRTLFGSPTVTFALSEGVDQELPCADLLILKDVLQHWPNADILSFLPRLQQCRYALITDCTEPAVNTDCPLGGFRGLDPQAAPFFLPCEKVLEYEWRSDHHGRSFKKATFLHAPPQTITCDRDT